MPAMPSARLSASGSRRPSAGARCAEFTRQGFDEGDPVYGRGWAALGTAERLVGHIFIHNGDDSRFVAESASDFFSDLLVTARGPLQAIPLRAMISYNCRQFQRSGLQHV